MNFDSLFKTNMIQTALVLLLCFSGSTEAGNYQCEKCLKGAQDCWETQKEMGNNVSSISMRATCSARDSQCTHTCSGSSTPLPTPAYQPVPTPAYQPENYYCEKCRKDVQDCWKTQKEMGNGVSSISMKATCRSWDSQCARTCSGSSTPLPTPAYQHSKSNKSSSRKQEIKELQQTLKDAGYDPGPVDGVYGEKTRRAHEAYNKQINSSSSAKSSSAKRHTSGPSFNCAKATTKTEKAICNHSELSHLDTQLAKVYSQLRKSLSKSDNKLLRKKQRTWLKRRNACSNNINCLLQTYEDRIAELENY
jgi:uncharacterized protein YecT (DUF1311 family)